MIRVSIKFNEGFKLHGKSELFYECHKIEASINDWKEPYLYLHYGKFKVLIYEKNIKEISFKYLLRYREETITND